MPSRSPRSCSRGWSGREDEVAIIDGPTGRALTAGALMGQIKRLAGRPDGTRRPARRHGGDPGAEHAGIPGRVSCRGLGWRHGDHDQPDLHRARDPSSAGRCGRVDAGHGPRLRGRRAGGRRGHGRARHRHHRGGDLPVAGGRDGPAAGGAGAGRSGEPRGRPALFQRHDRAAQGRDADPSQPRGQCAAIGCGRRDHRRRHRHRLPAVLPHLRDDGPDEPVPERSARSW
jgi:hypothetical protein